MHTVPGGRQSVRRTLSLVHEVLNTDTRRDRQSGRNGRPRGWPACAQPRDELSTACRSEL